LTHSIVPFTIECLIAFAREWAQGDIPPSLRRSQKVGAHDVSLGVTNRGESRIGLMTSAKMERVKQSVFPPFGEENA
jgi:hypothetical protein